MLVKVNKRVIYNLHNMYIYIKTPDNQSKRPLINNKKGHLKKKDTGILITSNSKMLLYI